MSSCAVSALSAVIGGTGSNCQEERLIIVVSRLYIKASLEVH